MRQLLLILVLVSALLGGGAAYAQTNERDAAACGQSRQVVSNPTVNNIMSYVSGSNNGAGTICPCSSGRWIAALMHCFAGIDVDPSTGSITHKGVILLAVEAIYNSTLHSYVNAITAAASVLALLLMAYKLITGTYQGLNREMFLTAFKVGGVLLFFSNFVRIHDALISATGQLVNVVMQAARNSGTGIGQVCPASQQGTPNIWSEWDCMIEFVLGGFNNGLILGLIGFFMSFFFKWGLGSIIAQGGMLIMSMLVLTAMRAVFVYLNAVMSIAFLFLISPIIVPMAIFKVSFHWFQRWFMLLLSFPLQIMVLYLMMILALTSLKYGFLVGQNSLVGVISNTAPKEPTFSGYTLINQNNLLANIASLFGNKPPDVTENLGEESKPLGEVTVAENTAPVDTLNNAGEGTGLMPNAPVSAGNNPSGTEEEGANEIKIFTLSIDITGMRNMLNVRNGAVKTYGSDLEWMIAILMRIIVCFVLLYVLMSLFNAVPKVSADIAAPTAFGVTKPSMLGAKAVRASMAAGKQAVRSAKQQGAKNAAKSSLQAIQEKLVGTR